MDYVIIVAGGQGRRMGSEVPKQFISLGGEPVLMRTIRRFYDYDPGLQLVVVLPRGEMATWRELCARHGFDIAHRLVEGGATRFESSRNGLQTIADDEEGLVAFHDGVRPFVSPATIDRCFRAAGEEYAAIPVVEVTSTLRYVDARGGGKNVRRADYREVQTPQVFDIGLAKQAFRQPYQEAFTDDASVVEALGCQVAMVAGNRENIKLTTPFDLKVAEALLG